MKLSFKHTFYFSTLVILMAGFISCSDDETQPDDGKPDFSVWLQLGSWPNTTQYVVGIDDLTSGEVKLEGNGAEVTSQADYGIVAHNGYYYYPSTSTDFGKLSKFEFKDNQMQIVTEVPFTYQSGISSHAWIDDNTLIFIGTNGDSDKLLYTVVDATSLTLKNGELDFPDVKEDYPYITGGHVEVIDGSIFISFNYTADWPDPAYPSIYLAEINYPDMTVSKITEDTRTLGNGGSNVWMSKSGMDEQGDAYMLFYPGWMYDSETNPAVVYRIKKGQNEFDQTYFFNLSNVLDGETIGFWYVGNGKAIVKYEDAATIKNNPDASHYMAFALIDLYNGTVVKRLTDIPMDKGSYIENVVVDNNTAYIVSNSESGKDLVWECNPETGDVISGIEIVGGFDFILRLDLLK